MAERFTVIAGSPELDQEVLWTEIDGRWMQAWFDNYQGRAALRRVCVPITDATGQVESVLTWHESPAVAGARWSRESYSYEDGRITTIAVERHEAGSTETIRHVFWYRDGDTPATVTVEKPDRDGATAQSLVYVDAGGQRSETARWTAEELMIRGVTGWASRHAQAAPGPGCVVLVYPEYPNCQGRLKTDPLAPGEKWTT